jgi:hypothetical protein
MSAFQLAAARCSGQAPDYARTQSSDVMNAAVLLLQTDHSQDSVNPSHPDLDNVMRHP